MEITCLDYVDLGLDRPGTRRRVLASVDQTLGRGSARAIINRGIQRYFFSRVSVPLKRANDRQGGPGCAGARPLLLRLLPIAHQGRSLTPWRSLLAAMVGLALVRRPATR